MTTSRSSRRSRFSMLLAAALAACMGSAHALQTVDASDGVSVDAVLSLKEPTRIRIEGAPITNVFGNIYSSSCGSSITTGAAGATGQQGSTPAGGAPGGVNPAGEVVLECDVDKGEIFVRPVGPGGKPVNLFVSSAKATYTLLLRRSDTPADTIVIRDKSRLISAIGADSSPPAGHTTQHVRSMKAMLVAMASDRVPADIRVEETNRPIQLWQEARFSMIRTFEGHGLIGERYLLTNVSGQDMVLAEQEFDRANGNVLGVAIENHNLRPGESTTVYVIRRGG